MEWYLTLPAVFCKRNKKMELESVLHLCNHQITHTQQGNTKKIIIMLPLSQTHRWPFSVNTGRGLYREVFVLFRQNNQKFSTVREEKNTCVFKLVWVFCFKGQEKWNMSKMVSSETKYGRDSIRGDIHQFLTSNSLLKGATSSIFNIHIDQNALQINPHVLPRQVLQC